MHNKRFRVDIGTTLRQVIRMTTNSRVINHVNRGNLIMYLITLVRQLYSCQLDPDESFVPSSFHEEIYNFKPLRVSHSGRCTHCL